MFCGLPHEEEGQGVTGEVEEAFPVPGGIGLGVRDEDFIFLSHRLHRAYDIGTWDTISLHV